MPENCPNPYGFNWKCDECPKYLPKTMSCNYPGMDTPSTVISAILSASELGELLIRRQLSFEKNIKGDRPWSKEQLKQVEQLQASVSYYQSKVNEHIDASVKASRKRKYNEVDF